MVIAGHHARQAMPDIVVAYVSVGRSSRRTYESSIPATDSRGEITKAPPSFRGNASVFAYHTGYYPTLSFAQRKSFSYNIPRVDRVDVMRCARDQLVKHIVVLSTSIILKQESRRSVIVVKGFIPPFQGNVFLLTVHPWWECGAFDTHIRWSVHGKPF